jgi:hypothetical protein
MNGNSQSMCKTLEITTEQANEQREEAKCFKCKELGHHARDCDGENDAIITCVETDFKVPEVAKHFYLA